MTLNRREVVAPLAAFFLVAGLGIRNGGYDSTTWGWASLALLVVTAAAISLGWAGLGRLEAAFLAFLAALLGWSWLSAVWSIDPEASVLEGERLVLYLAGAAVLVTLSRPVAAPRLLAAALAAIVGVCAFALGLRLLGSPADYGVQAADPTVARKLAEPVGYANAVGLLAAMGIALAVGFAVRSRAAAAAPVVLLPTLYFTFGRGAWLALAAGVLVAVAADPDRDRLAARLLVLAPLSTLAVAAAALLDGWAAVAAVAALAAAQAALPTVPLRVGRAAAVGLAAVCLAAAVVALVRAGGPVGLARSFAAEPTSTEPTARLLSLSGSGRTEYWRVAWLDVREHPWLGSGAGSFGRYWLQERSGDLPARDAHSLEFETLAEVGPVGLALLLCALAVPLVAGVRARRRPRAPAALGAYAAYLVHSAVDWDWEIPAVTLAAIACGAALVLLARPEAPPIRVPRAALVAVLALGAVTVVGLVGNRSLAAASDLLDRGRYGAAESQAERAARWAPWSSEAWRLRGEAQVLQSRVRQARASFREGLERDPRNWELWRDLGLASEGHAARRAFAHALALNPHSPELRELGVFGTG